VADEVGWSEHKTNPRLLAGGWIWGHCLLEADVITPDDENVWFLRGKSPEPKCHQS